MLDIDTKIWVVLAIFSLGFALMQCWMRRWLEKGFVDSFGTLYVPRTDMKQVFLIWLVAMLVAGAESQMNLAGGGGGFSLRAFVLLFFAQRVEWWSMGIWPGTLFHLNQMSIVMAICPVVIVCLMTMAVSMVLVAFGAGIWEAVVFIGIVIILCNTFASGLLMKQMWILESMERRKKTK